MSLTRYLQMHSRHTNPRRAVPWTITLVCSPSLHPNTPTCRRCHLTLAGRPTTCRRTHKYGLVRSILRSVVAPDRSTSSSATSVLCQDLDSISSMGTLSCACYSCFCPRLRTLTLRIHFSERYYSVFDTTNGQVGFAATAYTDSTSN